MILDNYLGNFSSTLMPIKINFIEEDGSLVAIATGQPKLILTTAGKDKFTFEQAGLTIQFNESKSEFNLLINGQTILFTRDK